MTAEQRLVRELAAQRRRVDALNSRILRLVQERGRIVLKIGELKRDLGCVGVDPRREKEMLRALIQQSEGPFAPDELREIFGALFRASLALQERAAPRATLRIGTRE